MRRRSLTGGRGRDHVRRGEVSNPSKYTAVPTQHEYARARKHTVEHIVRNAGIGASHSLPFGYGPIIHRRVDFIG